MLEKEYDALREELRSLKNCQITFLNISITSSGLLIGLIKLFEISSEYNIVFLVPLIIVIPSWYIFFDKATTITRIVGYFRILEIFFKSVINYNSNLVNDNFIGWENSLSKYRKWKYEKSKKKIPTHKYWLLTWLTFMLLSFISISLAFLYHIKLHKWPFNLNPTSNLDLINFIILISAILIFIISIILTGYILKNLIYGHYSYEYNEELWRKILEIQY